jgi:hypothetical protein
MNHRDRMGIRSMIRLMKSRREGGDNGKGSEIKKGI